MQTKTKTTVGFAAMLVALVGGFEGYRSTTYLDSTGTPTVCYGETKNVRLGQTYTESQCNKMFQVRLAEFTKSVEKCIKVPIPDNVKAASVSLAYNIGVNRFCNSTVAIYLNQGKIKQACEAFTLYNRSKGKVLQGLKNRREAEKRLCLG
jgi:lysozyme